MTTIKSFDVRNDGSFSENKVLNTDEKANELIGKFDHLAIDVVNEILDAIKHEDNVMYYEIKFWTEVKNILQLNN